MHRRPARDVRYELRDPLPPVHRGAHRAAQHRRPAGAARRRPGTTTLELPLAPAMYQPGAVRRRAVPEARDRRQRRRPVLDLQLGAVLPRAAADRDAPEQEPALRGGAALVPLRVRPDEHRHRDAGAAAVLEVPALPPGDDAGVHRRDADRSSPKPATSELKTRIEKAITGVARQAVPAARGRPRPLPRLPDERGDEVPRQPHRVGRHPVPPGHDRDAQRGHADLRAGREPARAQAAAGAAARRAGRRKTYAQLKAAGHRRVRQRAGGARERSSRSTRHRAPAAAAASGATGADAVFGIGRVAVLLRSRRTTSCSRTGTASPTGCSRSATA